MGIIFGKKKQVSRVTQQDKAILQLKQQRDKLKQYQKRIELSLTKDRELAKTLLNDGKKERAKLLLRKKRYQEQLLQKTDGQLENLERMAHDLEFAQIEIQVIDGLKHGNEALKKVNEVLNLEDIERILEETREGVEKQREIDALLSGALTEEDEEAVEAELQGIIEEALPQVPNEPVPVQEIEEPSLPEVPSSPVKEKAKEKRVREAVAMEA
ncbi:hypothetical protein ILUMI_27433 [Ignelater luminosus]|uniref:Charged multivesicular body protein 6 n=1 Tax=Ignelater luminosus TaxID=2038154 RepID=A0A8K0C3I8_IGNLU|nr:hypothetical protein ILUMI_27433 [Ignelater luminosus]